MIRTKRNLIFFILNILILFNFIQADKVLKEIKEKDINQKKVQQNSNKNKLKYIKLSKDLKTIMEDQKYEGEPLIVKFNNTDIKSVIDHFSEVLGYKIKSDPELKGRISFSSDNVPWNIVLSKFLFENKLDMVFSEGQAIIQKKSSSLFKSYYINILLILLIFALIFYFSKIIKQNKIKKSVKKPANLNPIFLDDYSKKIFFLFEVEKIFRDENLSIQTLSNKMSIQPYILSKIINKKMKTSFPSLLNRYRIAEAKKMLENSEFNNSNILDIAYQVGFKTKTAFNRTFKKETGLTPSQFKQKGK